MFFLALYNLIIGRIGFVQRLQLEKFQNLITLGKEILSHFYNDSISDIYNKLFQEGSVGWRDCNL